MTRKFWSFKNVRRNRGLNHLKKQEFQAFRYQSEFWNSPYFQNTKCQWFKPCF